MEFNYSKCPECGYVNKNQPDVCPSCGCDLKAYRDELRAQEEAEQARVADLANRAYSFISETVDGATLGEDENKNYLFSFIAAFFDGSNIGKFKSDTERMTFLLSALYRYYDENENKKRYLCLEYFYDNAIDLMGRYLSSSRNNRLKSAIATLEPLYGIKLYFNLIITELEFELSGKSPFKRDEWLERCVYEFVCRFLEDDELSKNEELKGVIEQYVTYLHNTYEKHDMFSDFTMEDCCNEVEGYYIEGNYLSCPHCDADVTIPGYKSSEEFKVKCAACGRVWTHGIDDSCPECGYTNSWDNPYGVNHRTCFLCGFKYDLVLADPDDDEGAIVSIIDDESDV